jgi:uncharacterized membrane protein YcaP (DUF421 family)
MEFVFRAVFIYFFLLVVFSIAGKRSLSQIDTFDFVLLLIISEATQQALIGQDYSLTTAAVVIVTLVGSELIMSFLKSRWTVIEKVTNGGPLVIVENGKIHRDRMCKEMVGEEDILLAARQYHGLERMDQIKYAILESGGEISIVPSYTIVPPQLEPVPAVQP